MCVGRIPTENERNHKDPIKTLNGIKNKIPKYSTCVTHKEFYDQYSELCTEPVILIDICRLTIDDESVGSSQNESVVDKCLVNLILESNNTGLLWNFQKPNGHSQNPASDPF